ncbi:MAG: Tll0287-like domain-containing protein [Gemmatimonadota bacterium]
MPNRCPSRLLILLAVPTFIACGEEELDEATRARVVTAGDSAATTLVQTLGGRLSAHMTEAGPRGAIAFCAGEAQALTDSVSRSLGTGWSVKRTTLRTRNPANAPDSLEAEALQEFRQADATGEPPEHLVQATPAGDYRYYRPLRLGQMCLECHGPRDALDPEVRTVLDERYPADQATGYAEGDFRGLVRVTVPREAVD